MTRLGTRHKVIVAVVTGLLGATLCTAGSAQAMDSRSWTGGSDVGSLRSALDRVVADGAPGVFARIEDSADGRVTPTTVSVGLGDISAKTPVDPRGRFRIGSITKSFTAVMVLKLVAEDRVRLAAPAADYLPAGLLPTGSTITVRDLLDHRSGLHDYSNALIAGDTVRTYQRFRYQTYDPAALVTMAVKHGPDFRAGASYEYSNTNFVVLGLLLEHVTGAKYADLLDRELIKPLGLEQTSFVVPETGISGPHAVGYLTQDDPAKGLSDATAQTGSWIWAAGAAISSTGDLDKYLRALTTGHVLPPPELAEMEATTPVDSTGTSLYGLGMREYKLPCGVAVYGHDGIVEGYETYAYSTKDGSRQVTISANVSNNNKVFAAMRAALSPAFCGAAKTSQASTHSNASNTSKASQH